MPKWNGEQRLPHLSSGQRQMSNGEYSPHIQMLWGPLEIQLTENVLCPPHTNGKKISSTIHK
jgi:hypothetical protein